jgi:hypothetical protein
MFMSQQERVMNDDQATEGKPADEDAYPEKTRALLAKAPDRSWSDVVAEEEQDRAEKIAKQRAARLVQVMK